MTIIFNKTAVNVNITLQVQFLTALVSMKLISPVIWSKRIYNFIPLFFNLVIIPRSFLLHWF